MGKFFVNRWNGLKWLEMAGNGWNGWKWLDMTGNGWIKNQWDGLVPVLTVSFYSRSLLSQNILSGENKIKQL